MAEKESKGKRTEALKPYLYKVEGGRLERLRQHCPKCGAGTFLARHADRTSCGHCGYTEFLKK